MITKFYLKRYTDTIKFTIHNSDAIDTKNRKYTNNVRRMSELFFFLHGTFAHEYTADKRKFTMVMERFQ